MWLGEVPIPEMGSMMAVKESTRQRSVGRMSISGTGMPGLRKLLPVPMGVGHEFVGKVVATGNNVHDLQTGDLVPGEGHMVCGRCRNCLAGRRHL